MSDYRDELRRIRSIQLTASLQKRADQHVQQLIRDFRADLNWKNTRGLLIEPAVWEYVRERYDPKLVFCHPDVLVQIPSTSLYYRGLCGLSIKAAKSYFGSIEAIESGNPRAIVSQEKALKMARAYNEFICSIIKNSSNWTLEDGFRAIIATMGITIDGSMRSKVGSIAEMRLKSLLLESLSQRDLLVDPRLEPEQLVHPEALPRKFVLRNEIIMRFGSDPDVAFEKNDQYLAVLEIKGGIDPAGALERYGAVKKTFEHALGRSPRCETFLIAAVETREVAERIKSDRLVRHSFSMIRLLEDPSYRSTFLDDLFNHALRLQWK